MLIGGRIIVVGFARSTGNRFDHRLSEIPKVRRFTVASQTQVGSNEADLDRIITPLSS